MATKQRGKCPLEFNPLIPSSHGNQSPDPKLPLSIAK